MFPEKIKFDIMKEIELPVSLLCDIFIRFAKVSFIKDVNSKFIFVHDEWSKIIGYSKEQMLGKVFVDNLTESLKNEYFGMDQVVLLSGEEQISINRIAEKDGRILVLKTRKNLYEDETGLRLIVGSVEDITEIEEIHKSLKETNHTLKKSNAEKDKFFSIVAHDLRSPFSGFLGLTEYLADNIKSMSVSEAYDAIVLMKDSAVNFHNRLENLLKWALNQRDMTDFLPNSINFRKFSESNINSIHLMADGKWIEIKNEIPDDLSVFADKNMVHSILINLITNAIKFTPKRGSIVVSAKEVSGDFIQVSIQDTGIGMREKTINNLFKIKTKITSNKGTEGELGTGLGLILCKDFVDKHGGKIWVESEIGIGSNFNFTLPKAK